MLRNFSVNGTKEVGHQRGLLLFGIGPSQSAVPLCAPHRYCTELLASRAAADRTFSFYSPAGLAGYVCMVPRFPLHKKDNGSAGVVKGWGGRCQDVKAVIGYLNIGQYGTVVLRVRNIGSGGGFRRIGVSRQRSTAIPSYRWLTEPDSEGEEIGKSRSSPMISNIFSPEI